MVHMLKMWANLLLCVLLSTLYLTAHAYETYQKTIPFGDEVPNPCTRPMWTIWPGVGHQNVYGSGPLNPFGVDFAANDHVWNKTLCEKDSDGDGKTNGEELSDPDCTWPVLFGFASRSHPGICEPLDSPVCLVKNSWLKNCGTKEFDCPAINEPGVLNYTLRIPVTPIPTKETTIICHSLVLPWQTVADIIAFEPIIDNAVILHHMVLYATNDNLKDHAVGQSYECSMESVVSCRSVIAIWGVGGVGTCLNSQVGFRMGSQDFRFAVLQLYWNNPELKVNQTDSSGMRIYYTSQLRPNRGQIAMVGQTSISIPPGKPAVTVTGNCSGSCTAQLSQSIFITASYLHMHTLGRAGAISLLHNGQTVEELGSSTSYEYTKPSMTELETPVELKPGYDIEVRCVYDSTTRNTTTTYGETYSDEMCYGFIAYYPLVEGLGFCGQTGTRTICQNKNGAGPCATNPITRLLDQLLVPIISALIP